MQYAAESGCAARAARTCGRCAAGLEFDRANDRGPQRGIERRQRRRDFGRHAVGRGRRMHLSLPFEQAGPKQQAEQVGRIDRARACGRWCAGNARCDSASSAFGWPGAFCSMRSHNCPASWSWPPWVARNTSASSAAMAALSRVCTWDPLVVFTYNCEPEICILTSCFTKSVYRSSLRRRWRTACASPSSTCTLCSQSMQPSVTDWP
jgi:hypothetical protein